MHAIGFGGLNGSLNFTEGGIVAPHAVHGNLDHVRKGIEEPSLNRRTC